MGELCPKFVYSKQGEGIFCKAKGIFKANMGKPPKIAEPPSIKAKRKNRQTDPTGAFSPKRGGWDPENGALAEFSGSTKGKFAARRQIFPTAERFK